MDLHKAQKENLKKWPFAKQLSVVSHLMPAQKDNQTGRVCVITCFCPLFNNTRLGKNLCYVQQLETNFTLMLNKIAVLIPIEYLCCLLILHKPFYHL